MEYKNLQDITVGFAVTGSFCVFSKVIPQLRTLVDLGVTVLPIFSETVYNTTTRFYNKDELIKDVELMTGKHPIHSITGAEPIGPKKMCDMIIVAPCTGNTMAKMAHGVVDSCVLMAIKAVHRNNGKIIVAISSNDALKANAVNLGRLLAMKNVYFVPFMQDDFVNKPASLVANMDKLIDTCISAMNDTQIQPILVH